MRRTRWSLYYLVGYLSAAGIALIAAPEFSMEQLGSNGEYGDVIPRLLGVVLLALAVLVSQIIRYQVDVLYPATLVARFLILAVLIGLYIYADDPFFLVLTAIVGLGVILTGVSYVLERRGAEVP